MKISVIVPVYNAEKYISRCIDSVLKQTYSNWELLLVDDGSKDGSLAILNDYAQKDRRIKVFHQENAGAGAARNVGLDNAIGDYIVFIDSDDFVETDYFSLVIEKNTDVVFLDVNRRKEDFSIDGVEKLSIFASLPKDDILRNQITGKMLWGGVRKAVKRGIIKEHNIRFSKHKVGEEAIYSFLVFYFAQDYSFIDKPVYNYILHSDSLSQSKLDDPWGDVAQYLKEKIVELGVYEKYADTLNAFFVTAAVVSLDKIAQNNNFYDFKRKAKARVLLLNQILDKERKVDTAHIMNKVRFARHFLKSRLVDLFFLISKGRRTLSL